MLAAGLAAEGTPDREYDPGHASRIPRKHIAAGILIRDSSGRIMFTVPVYQPTLLIAGGVCEDNESPRATVEREVREELGLRRTVGQLLVIDWLPTHGIWRDSLQMIYDGGIITDDELSAVQLPPTEIAGLKFLTLEEAATQVRPAMLRRLRCALIALDRGYPIDAEFGHPL